MQLNAYLGFDGTCEAAFRFYERALGGKLIAMQTYAGSPMESHIPADMRNRILHTQLKVGDSVLMGSDAPPNMYKPASGFHVTVQAKTPDEAERVFNALAEGGTINMPLAETFWAARFGDLTDRFGIPWMVNCDKQV